MADLKNFRNRNEKDQKNKGDKKGDKKTEQNEKEDEDEDYSKRCFFFSY